MIHPKVIGLTLTTILLAGSFSARGEVPSHRPTHGYSGGPYKAIADDFTGDGVVDVVLSYYPIDAVVVEQGNGRGQFEPLAIHGVSQNARGTIEPIYNIAHGDLDGDGLPDLAIGVGGSPPPNWQDADFPLEKLKVAWSGRVVIARNQGKGRFEEMLEYETPSPAKGVRLADLDNDGHLDLLYTARGSNYRGDLKIGRLMIRQGRGNWEFGPAKSCAAGPSAYYVETADLNHDGYLDIMVPNEHGDTVQIVMNPGHGVFDKEVSISARALHATRIPGYRGHAINDVRAAHFNHDDNLDLVTANLGTCTVSVFMGNGDGTFQPDRLLEGGKYCAFLGVGDFNKDGNNDFTITHWTKRDVTSVFLNRGDGEFFPRKEYQTGLGNYGVVVLDANRDGNLDILTTNYVDKSTSLLIGKGDGTFEDAVTTFKGLRLADRMWKVESR